MKTLIENMTPEQKDGIAGILIKQKFNPGEMIHCDGDPADCFYIIKKVKFELFGLLTNNMARVSLVSLKMKRRSVDSKKAIPLENLLFWMLIAYENSPR